MGSPSMVKRTVGTGGVFLRAMGGGVPKVVTVCKLGVAVGLGCLRNLEEL